MLRHRTGSQATGPGAHLSFRAAWGERAPGLEEKSCLQVPPSLPCGREGALEKQGPWAEVRGKGLSL